MKTLQIFGKTWTSRYKKHLEPQTHTTIEVIVKLLKVQNKVSKREMSSNI